jgi:hypothetical protein
LSPQYADSYSFPISLRAAARVVNSETGSTSLLN